jgi:hypothetical protein
VVVQVCLSAVAAPATCFPWALVSVTDPMVPSVTAICTGYPGATSWAPPAGVMVSFAACAGACPPPTACCWPPVSPVFVVAGALLHVLMLDGESGQHADQRGRCPTTIRGVRPCHPFPLISQPHK